MKDFMIVCPGNLELISRIKDKRLVLYTDSFSQVKELFQASTSQNSIHCIVVTMNDSLSSINFDEELKAIPLALYIDHLGDFKKFISMLSLIRELNLRIFLPAHERENITYLRIMSSLNIQSGLFFKKEDNISWDMINDLMSYSVYGQAVHSPIEPFLSVLDNYVPHEFTYFNSCYFENPMRYLHVDKEENIALSKSDMENKNFIAKGIENINDLKNNSEYQEALDQWHVYFLENRKCSSCPAWRICQGSYLEQCQKSDECYQFFSDLLEAADFHYLQKNKSEKWQS